MKGEANQLLSALEQVGVAQTRGRVEWQVVILRVRDHVRYLTPGGQEGGGGGQFVGGINSCSTLIASGQRSVMQHCADVVCSYAAGSCYFFVFRHSTLGSRG